MKKLALLIVVIALVYGYVHEQGISIPSLGSLSRNPESSLQEAYRNQRSDLQVQGAGTVTKVLRDDLEGSRHQRFILTTDTGQTLLVAHNIDIAPRINGLKTGDTVEFFGEYEWNPKGGVIHWTHRDPDHRHVGGWLRHQGRTYQ
jgi:hypothetical protein